MSGGKRKEDTWRRCVVEVDDGKETASGPRGHAGLPRLPDNQVLWEFLVTISHALCSGLAAISSITC